MNNQKVNEGEIKEMKSSLTLHPNDNYTERQPVELHLDASLTGEWIDDKISGIMDSGKEHILQNIKLEEFDVNKSIEQLSVALESVCIQYKKFKQLAELLKECTPDQVIVTDMQPYPLCKVLASLGVTVDAVLNDKVICDQTYPQIEKRIIHYSSIINGVRFLFVSPSSVRNGDVYFRVYIKKFMREFPNKELVLHPMLS